MGINPGEVDADWEMCPTPTEETSEYDFHVQRGKGRTAIRWSKACTFFLGGADYVLTELFLWSSANTKTFKERFGRLKTSKHLAFCTVLNEKLIRHYSPRAVILPGLGCAGLASRLYDLRRVTTISDSRHRLIEHMTDGQRPWFITKHWTGSHGFTAAQRATIREYIRAHSIPR